MKKGKVLLSMAAAACAFLVMCSTAPSVRISASDNQKEIKAKTGEVIELTLDTQPSTGYAWQVVSLSGVEVYGKSKVESHNDGITVGGVETIHLFFKTVKSGAGSIELAYVRSWEPKADAEKHYKVLVVIEDKQD